MDELEQLSVAKFNSAQYDHPLPNEVQLTVP